jgi:hypothetical protein
LRCFISSSEVPILDLAVLLTFNFGSTGRLGSLEVGLRGFLMGGVVLIKTDTSESLSSCGADFRFFGGGEGGSFDGVSIAVGATIGLWGDFILGFAGDEGGVTCIAVFFRRIFFAND